MDPTRGSRQLATEVARCAVCGADAARLVGSGPDFEYRTCDNEFQFVECARCEHVYLKNRPARSELSTIYPEEYGNYDPDRSRAVTFQIKSLLDARRMRGLLRLCPHARSALDVGCADGRTLDLCRRLMKAGSALWGVEISEAAATAARRKGYSVIIGTIDQVALPHGEFDLVFLQQVIEHVYAPDVVCRKLFDAARPGAIVVFETPTTDCVDFRWFQRRYWGGYHIPRHFNLFSEKALMQLCSDAGFEHVQTRYTPQPIHWVWTLRHALKERGLPEAIYRGLHIENALAIGCGTLVELAAFAATGHMSNMEVVVRRPE